MPKYVVGSVNKYGETLVRKEFDLKNNEYAIWVTKDNEYCVCFKRFWGTTTSFYDILYKTLDKDEAYLFFDSLIKNEDSEYCIFCKECGEPVITLTSSHLKNKHNMTSEQYLEKYPASSLWSIKYGISQSRAAKKRETNSFSDRNHSSESKLKMREAKLGTTRSEEAKKKQSDSMKKKWRDSGYAESVSIGTSKAKKEQWKDPVFARKMMEAWQVKPNSVEEKLGILLGIDYEYVGDGKFSIEGYIPDFININGKKHIVEMNGCYWHCCEKCGFGDIVLPNGLTSFEIWERDKSKQQTFEKYGYKVTTVWEHDL